MDSGSSACESAPRRSEVDSRSDRSRVSVRRSKCWCNSLSASHTPAVVLIPGGGSSVHAYFPELGKRLGERVKLIELDPPKLDPSAGKRWLRIRDHARFLADAIDADDHAPVVVVGHSLGGLVALRLVLDHRERVNGLLLLDPSPLMPAMLLPRPLLRIVGTARSVFQIAPRRATRMPPEPRALPLFTRLLWYLVLDGGALAADVSRTGLRGVPTVVVSADEHEPRSSTRRTHEHLAAWVPGATLEVWPGTTHEIPAEHPGQVADTIAALLDRVAPRGRGCR